MVRIMLKIACVFVLPILLHCVALLFITVFLSNNDFVFDSPAVFML